VQKHSSHRLDEQRETRRDEFSPGDHMTTMLHHKLLNVRIAAVAAALALTTAVLAPPAAADTNTPARSVRHTGAKHVRAQVRNSYASTNGGNAYLLRPEVVDDYQNHPYHCGIGLMNTPLTCEYDR
jgi:alpha-beta hydrolase superfamily lysophospholipase